VVSEMKILLAHVLMVRAMGAVSVVLLNLGDGLLHRS
jgi:hypothetical protein